MYKLVNKHNRANKQPTPSPYSKTKNTFCRILSKQEMAGRCQVTVKVGERLPSSGGSLEKDNRQSYEHCNWYRAQHVTELESPD